MTPSGPPFCWRGVSTAALAAERTVIRGLLSGSLTEDDLADSPEHCSSECHRSLFLALSSRPSGAPWPLADAQTLCRMLAPEAPALRGLDGYLCGLSERAVGRREGLAAIEQVRMQAARRWAILADYERVARQAEGIARDAVRFYLEAVESRQAGAAPVDRMALPPVSERDAWVAGLLVRGRTC